jgi:MraZ protein
MTLRGSHLAKVDEKGRVKVPADFLGPLRELGSQFFITSEAGDFARVYPMKIWNEIEEKLSTLSSHHPAKQKFLTRANYFGQVVELDAQGRLLIPPVLREAAQIKGEVDLQGYLTYMDIWNHGRLLEDMNNKPLTDEDRKTLDALGI